MDKALITRCFKDYGKVEYTQALLKANNSDYPAYN